MCCSVPGILCIVVHNVNTLCDVQMAGVCRSGDGDVAVWQGEESEYFLLVTVK